LTKQANSRIHNFCYFKLQITKHAKPRGLPAVILMKAGLGFALL